MKLKVMEHPDLVRDTKSNAILNIDNRSLLAYKKRKAQSVKMDSLNQRVKNLEDKLDQILTLLQQTINSK